MSFYGGVSLRSRGKMLITGLQDDGLVCRLILADNAVAAVSSATGMLDKTLVHQKTNIASDSALQNTSPNW